MRIRLVIVVTAALCSWSLIAMGADGILSVRTVDPLVKVFRDIEPSGPEHSEEHVARGETATFQTVFKITEPADRFSCAVSPWIHEDGTPLTASSRLRYVGFLNVDRPTQKPSQDQLRKPPADYPDILFEREDIPLSAHLWQPIWITTEVPLDAPAGTYSAVITLQVWQGKDIETVTLPITLIVYPVTLDCTRLWVTNWFGMHARHMDIQPESGSEEYYALLRRYARNMAEHRQNVALISPLSLTVYSLDDQGEIQFDFSDFDRWVSIFIEEGVIGRIEGGHIGGRKGDWNSQFAATIRSVKDGKIVAERVDPNSDEARNFYSRFLPALTAHLKERGWLDCYMQHLADEPTELNMGSYKDLAQLVRDYGPELKTVEANHNKDLVGAIDIWVPQLNYYHDSYDHYLERQAAGDEVWFYTCVFPQGEYANRFIEQPLMKTRLLHWINFVYGATGYLHWGYNRWYAESPYTHATPAHAGPPYLPAGDAWIVYPGHDGPLDSIRWEAMRDGVADHELLCRLAEAAPEKAKELATKHILDFDKYNTDVEAFRATRIELLKALCE
ncbi:MAG: DUF4091 domain-containing protein [Candidatus Hydrogenedentes bacterium]|nr:DUF4091 domain-containing protein [Candidatus Hydrogenedentota bacterium]